MINDRPLDRFRQVSYIQYVLLSVAYVPMCSKQHHTHSTADTSFGTVTWSVAGLH
jgi:hypothetical protein